MKASEFHSLSLVPCSHSTRDKVLSILKLDVLRPSKCFIIPCLDEIVAGASARPPSVHAVRQQRCTFAYPIKLNTGHVLIQQMCEKCIKPWPLNEIRETDRLGNSVRNITTKSR